jgi:hypothetical protein
MAAWPLLVLRLVVDQTMSEHDPWAAQRRARLAAEAAAREAEAQAEADRLAEEAAYRESFRGEPGAPGRDGLDGAPGLQGPRGAPGRDGIYVVDAEFEREAGFNGRLSGVIETMSDGSKRRRIVERDRDGRPIRLRRAD